ncbi:clc-like domain-containing protein [Ditylenchus destructor]|uniref:Clc-like domain-containing protein n=1 Tax=Ditylenchus destructor TaxID=166010 RepID=A0AAD4NEX8_9BILA|nr:clc-like domain-containing protein [Ditylenchus destructor]
MNSRGQEQDSTEGRSCPQLILILISLFLLLTAMILGVIGVMSPSWQIVDIREFQAEHHHGLWQDCTRADRSFRRTEHGLADKSPLHCTYKFDVNAAQMLQEHHMEVDSNSAAAESEHHQFYGWHKAVLVFIFLSLAAGALALCVGICTPCSPPCALMHSVLCFIAFLSAVVAASIFFFAAHRVDSRFVQGLVATYEQQIGEAFYCYVVSCILLMLVFILSIIGAYHALRNTQSEELSVRELAPLYQTQYGKTTV